MRLRVTENGLVIPPYFLAGLDEVEISREGDVISIEKVNKNSTQESIDISIVQGEVAQNLLEEKLKTIRELRKNTPENPAKVALAQRFSELCREIQELHTDNPLSEAEIAAEIEAVRIRE
ncbi:hypothetical protein PL8927_600231 [Planktothrix serta PCC 8927]|uniref:Uncharacterized protein n=1 Tax=Planktothrix serta PCC 8927 TaxID=671068 RepID=A0A7Z9BN47_9CYAN|nr:hypothetical protein [Planktothrix serta]VXD18041.1 hypothetical protein PL8927_600231 [Planktothrix serta PCC 8927]